VWWRCKEGEREVRGVREGGGWSSLLKLTNGNSTELLFLQGLSYFAG